MEGFGWRWDDEFVSPSGAGIVGTVIGMPADGSRIFPGIPAGSANAGSFGPLSGLFSQSKYIQHNLKQQGTLLLQLLIQFEHVVFSIADTSNQWQIEDERLAGDVGTLDNALQTYMRNMF